MTLKIEMDEENWIILVSFHVQLFKNKNKSQLGMKLKKRGLKLKLATNLIILASHFTFYFVLQKIYF